MKHVAEIERLAGMIPFVKASELDYKETILHLCGEVRVLTEAVKETHTLYHHGNGFKVVAFEDCTWTVCRKAQEPAAGR